MSSRTIRCNKNTKICGKIIFERMMPNNETKKNLKNRCCLYVFTILSRVFIWKERNGFSLIRRLQAPSGEISASLNRASSIVYGNTSIETTFPTNFRTVSFATAKRSQPLRRTPINLGFVSFLVRLATSFFLVDERGSALQDWSKRSIDPDRTRGNQNPTKNPFLSMRMGHSVPRCFGFVGRTLIAV